MYDKKVTWVYRIYHICITILSIRSDTDRKRLQVHLLTILIYPAEAVKIVHQKSQKMQQLFIKILIHCADFVWNRDKAETYS